MRKIDSAATSARSVKNCSTRSSNILASGSHRDGEGDDDGRHLDPRQMRWAPGWRFMAPRDVALFLQSARADARLGEMLAAGAPRAIALDRLYAEAPEFDPWRSGSEKYFYQRNKYDNLICLLPPNRRFNRSLDIGCGAGLLTERIAAISQTVVGMDLSATAVQLARERFSGRGNSEFHQADLLDLDASFDRSFDLIVIADVIYYLPPSVLTGPGLKSLASRLARLLQPGGVLLVANHYAPFLDPGSRVTRRIHHAFRRSRDMAMMLERWRPFWLAGLFQATDASDVFRPTIRQSVLRDHHAPAAA